MSMTIEEPCSVYVGASGAVFGFLGLYLAGKKLFSREL